MQRHMVEHRPEAILAVGRSGGQLHSLRDGGAERTLVVGVAGEDIFSGAGGHRRRRRNLCAVGLHDRAAVGLLVVRNLHLIDSCVKSEDLCSIGESSAPLSGSGLCCNVGCSFLLAVVALR